LLADGKDVAPAGDEIERELEMAEADAAENLEYLDFGLIVDARRIG
jgi:hypothetical protein